MNVIMKATMMRAIAAAVACSISIAAVAAEPTAPATNAPPAGDKPTAAPATTTSSSPTSRQQQSLSSTAQPAARRSTADRIDLDTTIVTGNRELPKVLYIVPWKKADIGELPAQPFNTLLDEVLTPVDRDVFRREVTYYGAIAADAQPASGDSATPGTQPPRTEK